MRGLTSPLWPIRYKPLPDELLSSWLVRLAHGHGLKVQTFCNLIFGNRLQVWNRDIDRLAPTWIIDELCYRTGAPCKVVWGATLRSYEGVLYRKFRPAGILQWILMLKMYHRKRQGHGLQFCPICLADDENPYYRKSWRLACNTVCSKHRIMLHDRCPKCATAIAFHRIDMARTDAIEHSLLSFCHGCGFDLRNAIAQSPIFYDEQAAKLLQELTATLNRPRQIEDAWSIEQFEVMRHLCGLMTSRYKHVHLREFLCAQLGIQDVSITTERISFEVRPVQERHHLLQLTAWLIVNLESSLTLAWRTGAVRYNVLLKDFSYAPNYYQDLVGTFTNWRDRFN